MGCVCVTVPLRGGQRSEAEILQGWVSAKRYSQEGRDPLSPLTSYVIYYTTTVTPNCLIKVKMQHS